MLELKLDRGAQGAGGKQAAVAEAHRAVDHRKREIAAEARVLQSVVHDDQAGAASEGEHGAGRPVARHDGMGDARQQQRLVAGLGRAMAALVDQMGRDVATTRRVLGQTAD